MTRKHRVIRVFIASPGDLAIERRIFNDLIDELNQGFGVGASVTFEALGWEDTLATTGRRSQAVINLEIDRCDVFVLAMHRRWGQDAPDATPYSSYTEEEFHRAYDRWNEGAIGKKRASPEIFVFFKHIDAGQMSDPGPQLDRVLKFRKHLEDSRQVLYHLFANDKEFKEEVSKHLRAYALDQLPKPDAPRQKVLLPQAVIDEIVVAKEAAKQAEKNAEREQQVAAAAIARANELALNYAELAAKAALDGRLEEARQCFSKATTWTSNLRILFLAYEFYDRTGDLATAERLIERFLAISGRDSVSPHTAGALGNLALIYRKRGDLDQAEATMQKAIAIDEELGNEDGLAVRYSNLGLIYHTRGKLDLAEEMYKKALAIDKVRGNERGMAIRYANLGAIYGGRGDLDRSGQLFRSALEIDERIGRQDGLAHDYINLGVNCEERGKLDEAADLYQKGLNIHEKLGNQEGMASALCNLGCIAEKLSQFDLARERFANSLDIYSRIGMPLEVEKVKERLNSLLPEIRTDSESESKC